MRGMGEGERGLLMRFLTVYFRHLARNPFICDCNMQWLTEYLHQNPIETSIARCEAPGRMKRKKIATARVEKFKCKGISRIPKHLAESGGA